MSILSPFTDLLRSALGVAEHGGAETVEHSPLHATVELEEKLDHLARALYRAAESAERQVELLDGVIQLVPALMEQVTAMNAQAKVMNEQAAVMNEQAGMMNEQAKVMIRELDELVKLLAPLSDAEGGVSRVEHLFRHGDAPAGGDQP
ncbi:MAG: hypothetical protein ACXVHJ_24555 [Solirubrobacteraceae bacterium]